MPKRVDFASGNNGGGVWCQLEPLRSGKFQSDRHLPMPTVSWYMMPSCHPANGVKAERALDWS